MLISVYSADPNHELQSERKTSRMYTKFVVSQIVIIATLLLATGCSDSSDRKPPPPPPSIVSLGIEPPLARLDIGNSQEFLAVATYSDGAVLEVSARVRWDLEFETGVIEGNPEPENGGRYLATALMGGQERIVATFDSFTTSASVEVADAELVEIMVMPGSVEVLKDYTQQLIAEGIYDDGHREDITDESEWVTDNAAVATVDTGLVSALSGGTANITASLGELSSSAIVNVRQEPELEYVEIRPSEATIYLDGSRRFEAYAFYSDGKEQRVTNDVLWFSRDLSVVSRDPREKNRFYGVAVGVAQITAELGLGNEGDADVTVEEVVLTHIITTPRDTTVEVEETRRFFTEAQTSDGRQYSLNGSPDLLYTVGDASIAYISNFGNDAGKLTGLREGTTTVTSTYSYEGEEFVDQVTVTVCKGDSC